MISLRKDEETLASYRKWEAHSPKAALLLVHGLGAHSGRWQFLAEFFLGKNISSYAIELKGFTHIKDPNDHDREQSFDVYFKDIRRLRGIIAKENIERKAFIVGESAGGLISFLMAATQPGRFDGLICLSPAFTNKLAFTVSDYIGIFSSVIYSPERKFVIPIDSSMCTRDVDYQKIMDQEDEDRLISARLLVDTALAQIRCRILKNRIGMPVLFLLAGEDRVVDSKASIKIFNSLKVEDKRMIQYPGMHHSLSIEMGRELVFQDIFKWLQKRI